MSKYTTLVRNICEVKSGINGIVGFDNVDIVLEKSWDKIFTTKCEFFNEEYRRTLCKKILKHYYMREIGAETVGLWQLWLNTKLEEIMPYYNQLYKSELLKYNPFEDTNITRTHVKNIDENSNRNQSNTDSGSVTNENESNSKLSENKNDVKKHKNLFNDTPQGGISGIESEKYLTEARLISENNNINTTNSQYNSEKTTSKSNFNGVSSITDKNDLTEEFSETLKGKQGSNNYSELLKDLRSTFLNIDIMIINEFEECFLKIW